MNSTDVRQKYLDFFAQNGHTVVPSDSLIPSGDPTLLFTSAGMVQFKKHFLGQARDPFTRAASCQKCFRTSDIEQVGKTSRHLTFFEMLGNFSFGDYFKKEAISWGWEFLTLTMGLPKEKLYATIYKDDDEAFEMWKKIIPGSRIARLGEDTNFWNMGPTGPCGPCSEILIDLGPEVGCKKPDCKVGCDCDRYLEIWNLVFTQFDRQEDGSLKNLPRKNIDTGMGIERLVTAVNGKTSNFDTDLFQPMIKHIIDMTGADPARFTPQLRMMADHARAVAFLIGDGIMPSNEGRGYVLRRILRRALRQGKLMGVNEPFLYKVTGDVVDVMKQAYPDLVQRREHIASIAKMEEEKFLETLEAGTRILDNLLKEYASKKTLPGHEIFKLYDTFGFPFDLTREIAQESGLNVDETGFHAAQKTAQERSRAAWSGSGEKDSTFYAQLHKEAGDTIFEGYEKLRIPALVRTLVKNGTRADALSAPDEGEIILDRTPFYAESGGQMGDRGAITAPGLHAEVVETIKPAGGLVVHRVKLTNGTLNKGATVTAAVDIERRKSIMRHHSATHLLHKALRQVLGTHVAQAGSLVAPDYFRFDFSHPAALKPEELRAAEEIVNKAIRDNMPVCISQMKLDEARKAGAMALFGEKYGETVRAVCVVEGEGKPPFSMELCGGTHVERTGDIGFFKIRSESSVASGTRRIEALAGAAAEEYVRRVEDLLTELSTVMKTSREELAARAERILQQQKEAEKEIRRLKLAMATGGGPAGTEKDISEVKGVKVIVSKVSGLDAGALRSVPDTVRKKIGSGIVIVVNTEAEKISFVVTVSADTVAAGFSAGKIAKNLAQKIGGSGGGKPEFAQGGGKDIARLEEALNNLADII